MKTNLLLEIQKITKREEPVKVLLPMPGYLFVQDYGRSVEGDMDEISKLLGMKEWFLFKTEGNSPEKELLTKFLLELERRVKPGREYEGCVLVELTGEEQEKEIAEFLSYINTQRHRLQFIYTTKETENVEKIRKQLAKECFVRVVYGECYTPQEQMELLCEMLGQYQFVMDDGAKSEFLCFCEEKQWKKEDTVRRQLQNMADEMVYEKMLEGNTRDTVIGGMELEGIIDKMKEKTVTRRQIGFI